MLSPWPCLLGKMNQDDAHIDIYLDTQRLVLHTPGQESVQYDVSTALRGPGEKMGSFCTPRGKHRIRAKIGAGLPIGTVFRGRRPTGEIYSQMLAEQYPDRDWILSRILWLGGCEPGRNRYGEVDSAWRYIYIHGTPDTEPMGTPASIGCIRMRNESIIDLFDQVRPGMIVNIEEYS